MNLSEFFSRCSLTVEYYQSSSKYVYSFKKERTYAGFLFHAKILVIICVLDRKAAKVLEVIYFMFSVKNNKSHYVTAYHL